MIKERFSINCDVETMKLIDQVAKKNHTSRSAITRMLLDMIRYVPVEKLVETSPVPGILGLQSMENTGDERS